MRFATGTNDGKTFVDGFVVGAAALGVMLATPAALAQNAGTSMPMGEFADGTEEIEGMESGVTVSEYMTVDIFVQDEDLATVLPDALDAEPAEHRGEPRRGGHGDREPCTA